MATEPGGPAGGSNDPRTRRFAEEPTPNSSAKFTPGTSVWWLDRGVPWETAKRWAEGTMGGGNALGFVGGGGTPAATPGIPAVEIPIAPTTGATALPTAAGGTSTAAATGGGLMGGTSSIWKDLLVQGGLQLAGGAMDKAKNKQSQPKLPQGLEWMGPAMQGLAGAGGQALNLQQPSGTIAGAGQTAGAAANAGIPAMTMGALGATGMGLQGLGMGLGTGFTPDMNAVNAALLPGLQNAFGLGAANLREQAALTGNTSGMGVQRSIADLFSNLGADYMSNVANLTGQGMLQGQNIQSQLVGQALGFAPAAWGSIINPAMQLGLQAQQLPLEALRIAFGGAAGAPYYAQPATNYTGAATQLGLEYARGKNNRQ